MVYCILSCSAPACKGGEAGRGGWVRESRSRVDKPGNSIVPNSASACTMEGARRDACKSRGLCYSAPACMVGEARRDACKSRGLCYSASACTMEEARRDTCKSRGLWYSASACMVGEATSRSAAGARSVLLAPRSDRGRCGGCPAPGRGEAALPVVQRPSHPGSVCARGGWLGGGMTGHPARRVRQARRRVRVRDARSQIGGTRG